MPQLSESMAALRVIGDALIPEEVSAALGSAPSQSFAKGEVFGRERAGRRNVRKFGLWSLHAERCIPENVNRQIAERLSKLTGNLEVWESLSRQYQIDLFCGWWMAGSDEGVSISPQNLKALGERGIELEICLYAPSEAVSQESE